MISSNCAYLLWQQSNYDSGFQSEVDFYYPACSEIEKRLNNGATDVSSDVFVLWCKDQFVNATIRRNHTPSVWKKLLDVKPAVFGKKPVDLTHVRIGS